MPDPIRTGGGARNPLCPKIERERDEALARAKEAAEIIWTVQQEAVRCDQILKKPMDARYVWENLLDALAALDTSHQEDTGA